MSEWPIITESGGYAIRARAEPGPGWLCFEMIRATTESPPSWRDPIEGHVKWDGCCDWRSGKHFEHLCGVDDLDRLRAAFDTVYDLKGYPLWTCTTKYSTAATPQRDWDRAGLVQCSSAHLRTRCHRLGGRERSSFSSRPHSFHISRFARSPGRQQ